MPNEKHPMQPIALDRHGTARFKENKVVRWMLDQGRSGAHFDLNNIAAHPFDIEDVAQFYMLIGYSVSGFGDVFNDALPELVGEADKIVDQLLMEST